MKDITWIRKKRSATADTVKAQYRWARAFKQALQEISAEYGVPETTLVENLIQRNGNSFTRVRAQLAKRVKELGGSNNENNDQTTIRPSDRRYLGSKDS